MKTIKHLGILTLAIIGTLGSGCKKFLVEKPYSQLVTSNFLSTTDGIQSTLAAAYATAANMKGNNSIYVLGPEEFSTDILTQSGDNVEASIAQYINFTINPSSDFLTGMYDPPYQTIRNANIVLENIGNVEGLTEQQKNAYKAESRFLRAISYFKLYFRFGPTPLRTNTNDPVDMARATDDEIKNFIDSELNAVIPDLPDPGKEAEYGRANKGAAIGYLTKFYLQTKQWQKSAEMAKRLIDLNYYHLYPVYKDLFKVENERNKEYIWVRPAKPDPKRLAANTWMNVSFPANFYKEPISGLTFQSNWLNWPNEFRILDGFYNSFENGDERKSLIISSYIDNSGKTISLLNNNNTRSFKYWPDPNAIGADHGNDIPVIRYADILLSRAEALNELNSPNQESIDLINEVRSRAGLPDIDLSNFASKESLRDHILAERGWEFYSEGKRRLDLIRMDKYISSAHDRGKSNAEDYHKLFPIPQVAIDANHKIVQNPGY